MIQQPSRLDYPSCVAALRRRLEEPAPGRIQLVTGPRQVGKTYLLLELQEELGTRAIYLAADGPEASLPGAWERLWSAAEELAAKDSPAVVLLDEAHLFSDWAARLKGEWDRLRRKKIAVHVVATGSSALRLQHGSKESLAGRFERLTLTHWSAHALAATFKLTDTVAADALVSTGSYPGAFALRQDQPRWSAYVRDAIIEPAIGRDIVALANVRRPALLRQVFGVCVSSPAQVVSLQKIQGQLQDAGALETVAHYLALLEDAYLVAALPKHASTPTRRRAAPPKLVVLNNALLAAADPRGVPARFGAWVENACLAHAVNAGEVVTYWREEPFEVDMVLDGTWGKWAVEVKTGQFGASDLTGLMELTRRSPAYRPLVLCDEDRRAVAERLGLGAMSWRQFLVEGLAGGCNDAATSRRHPAPATTRLARRSDAGPWRRRRRRGTPA
ncbi:MAG: ATP-binding protein [Deltaproteobacteria bacterium]|nr:ATP-binding protein [Deltaproteobacteria bacterium]